MRQSSTARLQTWQRHSVTIRGSTPVHWHSYYRLLISGRDWQRDRLQWTSSFHPSSMALDWMWVFSARQDRYLPESSLLGVNVKVLVVTLPSTEILSRVRFILVLAFHQLMVAGGLEPALMQWTSTGLSADSGFRSPSMRTKTGRTVKKFLIQSLKKISSDLNRNTNRTEEKRSEVKSKQRFC